MDHTLTEVTKQAQRAANNLNTWSLRTSATVVEGVRPLLRLSHTISFKTKNKYNLREPKKALYLLDILELYDTGV